MGDTSADFPKFVSHRCDLSHELRKVIGTSNLMNLVPTFHLTGLKKIAAGGAGPSNEWC